MGKGGKQMIRLALLEEAASAVEAHLAASAPLEDAAFCLLQRGRGITGTRLVATKPFLASPDAWRAQDANQLSPSGRWLSQAISRAVGKRSGLLFVHSHPSSKFPPNLSWADREAFTRFAAVASRIVEGPLAAAVVHPTGWSAELWVDGQLIQIDRIVAVGRTLRFLSQVPSAEATPLDDRQRTALGPVHDGLRLLSVGVVGCGGLGSPIAEQLARAGVAELVIVDRDVLDTPSNLRRVFGSTARDLNATPPPHKVDVVGQHIEWLALGAKVRRIPLDVRTEAGFRPLLDTDVVIIGTDNHGSRATVNELPSTYLLPVVDIGVRVGSKANGQLAGLFAEVRVLTPETPCLWCRDTISADVIRVENLPEQEREKLKREGYVVGYSGEPEPSVVALTVLGSGLATCALVGLLSEAGRVAPSAYVVDGLLGYVLARPLVQPVKQCRCRTQVGLGDSSPPPFLRES